MTDAADNIWEFLKVIAAPGAVTVLGWWLRGQFTKVSDSAATALKEHDEEDTKRFTAIETIAQSRHEENLRSLNAINVSIARLGSPTDTRRGH